MRPLLPVLLLLALPVPAGAATVGFGRVTAAPGEANALSIAHEPGRYVIRDQLPLVLDNAACTQPQADTVVCPDTLTPAVDLGDGADRFAWTGPAPEDGLSVDGGPGEDVIAGTAAADHLRGGDDAVRDVLDFGAGADFVRAQAVDVVVPGPGQDEVEAAAGADLRLRDGEQDRVRCDGPLGGLEADLRTSVGFPDDQDLVHGCSASPERAPVEVVSTRRRFRITKRSRTFRLTFGCPAAAALLCETVDLSDLGARACQCSYEARSFRILPGERLTVAFRIQRRDLRSLRNDLHFTPRMKGALTWISQVDDYGLQRDGVAITFIRA